MLLVALHPEGVDRNYVVVAGVFKRALSPSTRRAWIEIAYAGGHWLPRVVALHPEGVDRNAYCCMFYIVKGGRPPPGGRG